MNTALQRQIAGLDPTLFDYLEAQTGKWDRRALLACQSATAELCGSFSYLEVGSYLGGSLQAVMRDPRCKQVISIDARPAVTPDNREPWIYEHNTTEHMLEGLRGLPDVDMGKLETLEAGTDALAVSDLPVRPDYCFVDGEHTHEAVLRDARFCAEAVGGTGVIAFHDYVIVGSAISAFVRENWREISFALAFSGPVHPDRGGGVFALELGGRGTLSHPAIERVVASRWHEAVWKAANRPRRTALPFLLAWTVIPAVDSFVVHTRHGLSEYVSGSRRTSGARPAH